jgi:hypothetical protein
VDIALAGSSITYQPNDDQLAGLSLELAAFDGEVGIGQVPTPDPSAGIDVFDGRSCDVREIATLIVSGFIIDQDRERGPQPAGTARMHTFSVQDPNALLAGFRVERTRPAETDYARVMAFAAADHPTWITTWVLNANTVTMPKKTYASDGGWTGELIPDVIEFTGKTLFVHDLAYGGRCLHYHVLTSGHTCGLTISDVSSAVNGVTVFAPGQPRRQRTSVDLRNDVKMRDQTGRTSSVTDATSITDHDADGLEHQTLIDVEAGSQADLDVKAAAFLASNKDELDTYTCDIGPLDATATARIRVGDIITVTSSVMGLTASPQRISHLTWTVWQGRDGVPVPGLWKAGLELGAPIRRRARVTNKTTTFPDDEWVCVPTDFTVPWNPAGTGGSCVIPAGSANVGGECDSNGIGGLGGALSMTIYAGVTYAITYHAFHAAATPRMIAQFLSGANSFWDAEMGSVEDPGTWGPALIDYEFTDTAPALPGPAHYDASVIFSGIAGLGTDSSGSEITGQAVYVSGADPRFDTLGACSNGAPRVGQRVKQTAFLGDGTTVDFTTDFPPMANSLTVFVNGLDWTQDIATVDTTTGDFTMTYPFPLNSTVVIRYRRAS